jgi:hypothetical protein
LFAPSFIRPNRGWQDFYRDIAVQMLVVGPVDFPHATGPDLFNNPVVPQYFAQHEVEPKSLLRILGASNTQVNATWDSHNMGFTMDAPIPASINSGNCRVAPFAPRSDRHFAATKYRSCLKYRLARYCSSF